MSVFKRKSRERSSRQHHVLFFLLIIAANEHLIDPATDIWHCAVFSEGGGGVGGEMGGRRGGGQTAVNLLTGINRSSVSKLATYFICVSLVCDP